ncbi:MAG: hypothetical protein V1776_01400 [Candidatus Diapherotrites archaeon]
MEKGNTTAALGKLRAAANDIIARRNQLQRQHVFFGRRAEELSERMRIERERLEKYVGDNRLAIQKLGRVDVHIRDIHAVLERLRYDYQSLGRKREPELKEAREIIKNAGIALAKKKKMEAIDFLQKANRLAMRALSRQYVLPLDLLQDAGLSKNKEWRKTILSDQLRHAGDNVQYWYSRARRPDDIATYLSTLAQTGKKDFPPIVAQLITESVSALERGNPTLAEERLILAREALPA